MFLFFFVHRTIFNIIEFNKEDIQDYFNISTVVLWPFVRHLSKIRKLKTECHQLGEVTFRRL